MPSFLLMLGALLVDIAATLVGRVLLALGIGYVSFTGLQLGLDQAKQFVIANLSVAPSYLYQLAALMGIGNCVSIIFSAITARLIIGGLNGGAIKKMIFK